MIASHMFVVRGAQDCDSVRVGRTSRIESRDGREICLSVGIAGTVPKTAPTSSTYVRSAHERKVNNSLRR